MARKSFLQRLGKKVASGLRKLLNSCDPEYQDETVQFDYAAIYKKACAECDKADEEAKAQRAAEQLERDRQAECQLLFDLGMRAAAAMQPAAHVSISETPTAKPETPTPKPNRPRPFERRFDFSWSSDSSYEPIRSLPLKKGDSRRPR